MEAAAAAIITKKVLPKYVMIQSSLNHRYLHLEKHYPNVTNALRFAGEYSFDLETRFEVVPATTGTGLIHIRSLKNNKYWANFGTADNWVTAMADKPEENRSDPHCTLIEPVFVNSNSHDNLMLRHVSTGYYIRFYIKGGQPSDGLLNLSPNRFEPDVCTFIDWESLFVLPDLIRIKENGRYLQGEAGDKGIQSFLEHVDNSPRYDYEVSPSRDGGVRLKNTQHGTYWTSSVINVELTKASTTEHDLATVFFPIMINGNRIILRCLKSDLVCKKTADNVLVALHNYPDENSYMEIEEPVFSRKIDNVRYHLPYARIYNEKSVALNTMDTSNKTHYPLTSEIDLKAKVSNTTKWSARVAWSLGISVTLAAGVPVIGENGFDISPEVTGYYNWGEIKEDILEIGNIRTITLPPMTGVKTSLMATRCSYDIPFSYTVHDVLINGKTKTSEKTDGIFTGNNGYGYHNDIVEHPL